MRALIAGPAVITPPPRARILGTGVIDGGRFVLREGNNMPPGVPLENFRAMYAAARECGRYD